MSEKLISNDNIMIKSDLEKLNQSELINLLLNQDKMLRQLLQEKQQKPIAKPRAMKPVPPPRKNVQQCDSFVREETHRELRNTTTFVFQDGGSTTSTWLGVHVTKASLPVYTTNRWWNIMRR